MTDDYIPQLSVRVADLERTVAEHERRLEALAAPVSEPGPAAVAEEAIRCRYCGGATRAADRFCGTCGRALQRVSEPLPAAAPAAMGWGPPAPARPLRPPRPRRQLPTVSTTAALAWTGGAVTVLGLSFLFVLAASRGWITPAARLTIGAVVSVSLIAVALRLHHRRGPLHGVLAAAGAGIGGLYVTLFAATAIYHELDRPQGLAGAAMIALASIAVALHIDREELAVFGVGAAMLAPLAVVGEVTTSCVWFASVMAVFAPPLVHRRRWNLLAVAVVAVSAPQAFVLAAHSGPGGGVWAAAVSTCAAVWMTLAFQRALRPSPPRRLDLVTAAFTSSSAAALALTTVRAGRGHELLGTAAAGWYLLLVTAVLGAAAAVPAALRRPLPDLTDLLCGDALAALAVGFGLMLHGSALVLGWGADAAVLALVGERIARRGPLGRLDGDLSHRGPRVYAAASVYLGLTAAAASVSSPLADALNTPSWGSHAGLGGLLVLVLAGVVWCAVALRSAWAWRGWTTAAPLAFTAYGATCVLSGEPVIVAWCVMAAATALSGFHPTVRRTLGGADRAHEVLVPLAATLTGLAATVTLTAFAAPDRSVRFAEWGSATGATATAAVLAACCATAALVLATGWPGRRWVIVAPAAVAAYLVAEVLPGDAAMIVWCMLATGLALSVHEPAAERVLGRVEPLSTAAGLVLLTALEAAAHDRLAAELVDHGGRDGVLVAVFLTIAAAAIAAGIRDRSERTVAGLAALGFSWCALAAALPGGWAVAAWGVTIAGIALFAAHPGRRGARLLDLQVCAESSVWLGLSLAALCLAVYETPDRLFEASPSPASGLVPMLGAVLAVWASAHAVRRVGDLPRVSGTIRSVSAVAALLTLWAGTAAVLGAAELRSTTGSPAVVKDHFQQGHLVVSATWGLVGLALLSIGVRRRSRALRTGGIVLLFVTIGKLFLYDLSFLPATSRAASFIITGLALIAGAIVLQRLSPDLLGGDGARRAAE